MQANHPPDPPTPAPPPPIEPRAAAARPALHQLWMNLKVWAPFLTNPIDRSRLVRYEAQEHRVGLRWSVVLPRQCWRCGQTTGLARRDQQMSVRAFENALQIAGGIAAALLAVLVLQCILPPLYTLFLMLLIPAVGSMILWLKSWREEVHLSVWACEEHAQAIDWPDMAIDDEKLHLFLADEELAALARQEIVAQRRAGRRAFDSAPAPQPEVDRRPEPEPPPIRPARMPPPVVPDLPPIRLAGEEDDSSGS